MRFGEALLAAKAVTSENIEEALSTQRYKKVRVGRLLRDLGFLKQTDLNRHLLAHLHPQTLESVAKATETLKAQSFQDSVVDWCTKQGCLPFSFEPTHFTIISPCFRDEMIELAEQTFKRPCELYLVDLEGFRYLKAAAFGNGGKRDSGIVIEQKFTDDQKISALDPYTSLFRDTILAAKECNASDIHIQPSRHGVDIRFRVNGDLSTWKTLDLEHRQSFINEVKRLTNLSIAVSGKAQDGRVSFQNWKLDIRASLLPSQYGEKVVLRLLYLTRSFELEKMGLEEGTLHDLKTSLDYKNGVLIVSGPTGSGKTSTLYTLLSSLDRNVKNIITLEDPVEYGIDGITQVQVTPKLSFSNALRSVLRQDPDVILVGEIRDGETADLCAKAAMTGHLVLSTLHANGAAEVVSRLLNLGVDTFTLRSCLRFSAAQRLIKRLCPSCALGLTDKQREELSSRLEARELTFDSDSKFRVRNRNGCSQCAQGIVGRVPILEYMREHEIQDYLSQSEVAEPRVAVSLASAALKFAERGDVDVFDAVEID